MKKNLAIILIILIVLLVITEYYVYNVRRIASLTQKNNQVYESYYQKEILGTELISLINKVTNENEKNAIDKKQNTIYYENNSNNSIQITIKFLEKEETVFMEDISQKESETFVKLFGTFTFKCTNIKYHEKTKNIQSMHFEQIEI